jgi:hypothetical protein
MAKPYMQHLVQVSGVACGWDGIHIAQVLPLVVDEQPVVLLHEKCALRVCKHAHEVNVDSGSTCSCVQPEYSQATHAADTEHYNIASSQQQSWSCFCMLRLNAHRRGTLAAALLQRCKLRHEG